MAKGTQQSSDTHTEVQAAGKSLMNYTFSLMKTGEVHELNNDAWIRPVEKLRDALQKLFRFEDQAVTFVVYDGLAQVNSHALWLDKGNLEQVEELERFLGRREAGGIVFKKLPQDDEVKEFFFHFARFNADPEAKDQRRAFTEMLEESKITGISVTPQPLDLDGMGQGVRGVPAIWHYCKAVAGIEDIYSRRPLAIRDAIELAQSMVDACALEQDLLVGFTLLGAERSIARDSVNTAVLCAAIGRGMGLERVHCADLAICGMLHLVGSTYPNPDMSVWTSDESASLLALRQLNDTTLYNALIARRICTAVEWRMGPDGRGAPHLNRPKPLLMASQLIKVIRHYLDLIHHPDAPRTPFSAGMELLEDPPSGVEPALIHTLIGVVGLLPVGSLVELQNGDLAVVSDIDHLRGQKTYGQQPPPVANPRVVYVDRMYTAGGEPVPERRARVQLGESGPDGEWVVHQVLGVGEHRDIIVRGMFRRPPTVAAQLGVRAL